MIDIKKFVLGSFQTNCYIVYKDNNAIVIDPGDDAKKIKKFLLENQLNLLAILLTHGHCDHIGAVDMLYQEYKCEIYLHEEDHIYLTNPKYNLSTMLSLPLIIHSPVKKAPNNIQIGQFNISFIHLPGHTPGSCMIEFVDEGIIFSGDVLFKGSIGRYDFPLSSKHDTCMTIKRLYDYDHDAIVYPGHGESTSINNEKQNNPFFTM